MPVEEVVEIVTAVSEALDYAHDRGLLHRDVKPANILLESWGARSRRAVLADFGIARRLDDISGLTSTNMTVGTAAYSAPEQLMGVELDGRADQYALAATAYHLLTGSQLFPHSNPVVVISRHLNWPPPALADTRPDLAALDPALARALAKDPGHRFVRCSDFARALAEHGAPGAAPTSAPTTPAPAARKPATPPATPTRWPDRSAHHNRTHRQCRCTRRHHHRSDRRYSRPCRTPAACLIPDIVVPPDIVRTIVWGSGCAAVHRPQLAQRCGGGFRR